MKMTVISMGQIRMMTVRSMGASKDDDDNDDDSEEHGGK